MSRFVDAVLKGVLLALLSGAVAGGLALIFSVSVATSLALAYIVGVTMLQVRMSLSESLGGFALLLLALAAGVAGLICLAIVVSMELNSLWLLLPAVVATAPILFSLLSAIWDYIWSPS